MQCPPRTCKEKGEKGVQKEGKNGKNVNSIYKKLFISFGGGIGGQKKIAPPHPNLIFKYAPEGITCK